MPIRDQLPEALRLLMQNGMLERTFQDGLLPQFLYPAAGTNRPWQGGMGDTVTFTRIGFLDPVTDSLNGADPSAQTPSSEQYSMTMADYGNSVDTDLVTSSMSLSSLFLENVQKLGVNAGQSLNRIARNRLYDAYSGGRSWVVTAQGSASTTCVVNSAKGFAVARNATTQRNEAVSATNPLTVTVAGVANTVVGVDLSTDTLTLGTAVTQAAGDAVVAANAPFSVRAGTGNDTAFDIGAADNVTFKDFRAAVTRLRRMSVPTVGGAYVAHINAETEAQLFDDVEFQRLYEGAAASPVYQNLSLGRFGGIDWVRNEEAPTISNGTITVQQPIVCGSGGLINGPFQDYIGALTSAGQGTADIRAIGGGAMNGVGMNVALITRLPQDKMHRKVSSSWGWIGDFAIPTDVTTGDASLFKRCVVVEHA